MSLPRIRIVWVMVAVAFVACNFAAIRPALDLRQDPQVRTSRILLILGALPMGNILIVVANVGYRCPARRPLIFGFEVLGWFALTVFASLATSDPEKILAYLWPILSPLAQTINGMHDFFVVPTVCAAAMVVLTLPQLAFAVFGGFLCRVPRRLGRVK